MIDTKEFTAAQQAAVEQYFALSSKALEGVEQLTALNLQVAKTVLAESAEEANAAMSARSPEDLYKLQASIWKSAPEKSVAYVNQVKAIVDSTFLSHRAAAEAKLAETQAQFVASLAGMLKNAPGSDNALALVKSAVAASNNAYEGVNKATRQVVEAVEANVSQFAVAANKATKAAA
ncbi:phasin family protein [Piscinibacter sakaiensis]|uniref:phasin family protein n=1 Tax=Piscinibacter sakaiensis TaxID=1547922 RepID=UPI003AACE4E2